MGIRVHLSSDAVPAIVGHHAESFTPRQLGNSGPHVPQVRAGANLRDPYVARAPRHLNEPVGFSAHFTNFKGGRTIAMEAIDVAVHFHVHDAPIREPLAAIGHAVTHDLIATHAHRVG